MVAMSRQKQARAALAALAAAGRAVTTGAPTLLRAMAATLLEPSASSTANSSNTSSIENSNSNSNSSRSKSNSFNELSSRLLRPLLSEQAQYVLSQQARVGWFVSNYFVAQYLAGSQHQEMLRRVRPPVVLLLFLLLLSVLLVFASISSLDAGRQGRGHLCRYSLRPPLLLLQKIKEAGLTFPSTEDIFRVIGKTFQVRPTRMAARNNKLTVLQCMHHQACQQVSA